MWVFHETTYELLAIIICLICRLLGTFQFSFFVDKVPNLKNGRKITTGWAFHKTSYNNLTIIFKVPWLQKANLKSPYESTDRTPLPK
jgi:hypothetical protein